MSSWDCLFLTLITGYDFARQEMVVGTYTVPACVIVALTQVSVPLSAFYHVGVMSPHTGGSDSWNTKP